MLRRLALAGITLLGCSDSPTVDPRESPAANEDAGRDPPTRTDAARGDPPVQPTDAARPSGGDASSGNDEPSGERVDNPFAGAKGYVNPEWRAKAMAEPGGERIANTPTAVWLDRIAAIEGTSDSVSNGAMGLADHLDAAVAQGADYAQFVIYDLPGRDCSALASNGELGPDCPTRRSRAPGSRRSSRS